MNTPISASLPDTHATVAAEQGQLSLYLELAKARLGALVVVTTIAGYVLAARGHGSLSVLMWTVIGTTLTAFGAAIFNQIAEVDRDRCMKRTSKRPLPSGRVSRSRALVWGVLSSLLGLVSLSLGANLLTAALALFVILLYVLVYTPMKVRTPLNTVVGAVCGAIPPMMGWTAATGQMQAGGWILFAILFVWQVPHFLALAWLYREDYARGGFRMLPAVDLGGRVVGRVALVYALSLLPLCVLASLSGVTGSTFLIGSQVLGFAFLLTAWKFSRQRTDGAARRLFLASVLYLPLVLGLAVTDMDDRLAAGAFIGAEPQEQADAVHSPVGVQSQPS